jgi:hypothetical protein
MNIVSEEAVIDLPSLRTQKEHVECECEEQDVSCYGEDTSWLEGIENQCGF